MSGLGLATGGVIAGDDAVEMISPVVPIIPATAPPGATVPRVRNIYIDPETGQFALDASGQLVMVADGDSIVQAIRCAIQLVVGEWFLDQQKGVDWFGTILVKGASPHAVREELRATILSVAGVNGVTNVSYDFDAVTRALEVDFIVSTDLGLLSGSVSAAQQGVS